MTLVDIKNKLVTFFLENDTFNVKEDLDEITQDKGDKNEVFDAHKEDLIVAALYDLEKSGIVKEIGKGDVFILSQPIGNFVQTVEIGPYTAELIAQLVNSIAQVTGETDELCNKLAIEERDISNIISICHTLMQGEVKKEKE